jgi:hypothetical protein
MAVAASQQPKHLEIHAPVNSAFQKLTELKNSQLSSFIGYVNVADLNIKTSDFNSFKNNSRNVFVNGKMDDALEAELNRIKAGSDKKQEYRVFVHKSFNQLFSELTFDDVSFDIHQTNILLTIKLNQQSFLRISTSTINTTEDPTVFAYYLDKKMLINGAGSIADVNAEIKTLIPKYT